MITISQYVGSWIKSKDWTPVRQANAEKLLIAVNALMAEMEAAGVIFQTNPSTRTQVSGTLFGGFRPQSCVQGAKFSSHKEGLAVDIYDPTGAIDAWLLKRQDALVAHGIYIESPDATEHWSHWSIKKPLSGKHIFTP